MGLAQTGTGKTAAFMLPILQRLTSGPLRQTRALIIAPTRELAEQIHQATQRPGPEHQDPHRRHLWRRGQRAADQGPARGTEIIVACPGRLLDLTSEGHVDYSHDRSVRARRGGPPLRHGLPARHQAHHQQAACRPNARRSSSRPPCRQDIKDAGQRGSAQSGHGADRRDRPGQDRVACPLSGAAVDEERRCCCTCWRRRPPGAC